MASNAVFFYGSLRDPELLRRVLGREAAPATEPAVLDGHALRRVAGEAFPCLVPDPDAQVSGAVLREATDDEVARIRFFEDEEEYALRETPVRVAASGHGNAAPEETLPALVCFPVGPTTAAGPWSFDDWPEAERRALREAAVEIMAHYEAGTDWSDLSLWPGLKARAAARARALAEAPGPRFPGVDFAAADVETAQVARPYASFFAVEEHHLSFPMSGGRRSEVVRRAVWLSGDAVTVLPYDPAADAVLPVTQWRAGPHARGDAHPWPVEVIAGRLDEVEAPEDAARREAREEAGLTLGRVERIAAFYSSPGAVAEHVTAYVGEADLSAAGGAGGLAAEAEDVISAVLPFEEAMGLVERQEADTSPALISLLWLARHRNRLRRDWSR